MAFSVVQLLYLFWFTSCCYTLLCSGSAILQGQSMYDGQILLSENRVFELAFCGPGNGNSRFLCIQFHGLMKSEIIWTANRASPVHDGGGVLTFQNDGNLVLLNGQGITIWSTSAQIASKRTMAVLQNTGNFILFSNKTGEPFWQSFDQPVDVFVPGMKLKVNVPAGENRALTSWTSETDPSPGSYSMGIDARGAPQIVIWKDSQRMWRSDYWNGQEFPDMTDKLNDYHSSFLIDEDDFLLYIQRYTSSNTFFRISWDGFEKQMLWSNERSQWTVLESHPSNKCEAYNKCGTFGVCTTSDSSCKCLYGFRKADDGCSRRTPLNCTKDGFLEISSIKLPDFAELVEEATNASSCEQVCSKNCSCIAYATVKFIGCLIWTGTTLIDVNKYATGENSLHVRLALSDLGAGEGKKLSIFVIVTIVVGGAIMVLMVVTFAVLLWSCKAKLSYWLWRNDAATSAHFINITQLPSVELTQGNQPEELVPEVKQLSFSSIASATNNFLEANKLGSGGFGTVYKGHLQELQAEVAVKRLSALSSQGEMEFKNDIGLIANLQHRNLVTLLGCCIEGNEKILLYEFLANKSLDLFLFDPAKGVLLDWSRRFKIIKDIARGLLYLHRDSRLRVIHRDLKASNILLDVDFNPKISDFGLAKLFSGNQDRATTTRIIGTFGYMSPEYASSGVFSEKSDVYSFGVLVLEIVSGWENNRLGFSLIDLAWNQWVANTTERFIDCCIANTSNEAQVQRCVHVGLLCVQDNVQHRPDMANVLMMLEGQTATLPIPREPRFTTQGQFGGSGSSSVSITS